MEINKIIDNNTITIQLSGRLDTQTSPELRKNVQNLDYSNSNVIFDFKELEYISSAGLRELLVCRKKLSNDRMKIINVNDAVEDVFEVTGFSSILNYSKVDEDISELIHLSFKNFLKHKVSISGDKTIVVHNGCSYTWKDIDACSNVVAEDLQKQGVKKGTHVALCGLNSANWIIAFFAVQKLGAVALLANFSLRESEIISLSKAGDITHFCYGEILSMSDKEAFLSEITCEKSCIRHTYDIRNSVDFRKRVGEVTGTFNEVVEADDACVMIFTSGSTGNPKGVLLSAYNIMLTAEAAADITKLTKDDKACLFLPLFHIFGLVAGLFDNAIVDVPIYLPTTPKPDEILSLISNEKCTIFHSVPTMILAMISKKDFSSDMLSSLRCTALGGAPSTKSQIMLMQEKCPNNHFMVVYGLSEMAMVSVTKYGDTVEHVSETVGKPVENVEVLIRNVENGEKCPQGVAGEILVQGYNMMCYYYKADIDFQSIDEDGWLHTGDLGWLDNDGYLRIVGRAKELIIRGGENIMPNEVAAAISSVNEISDVKVIGVPDDFFGEAVAACLILKSGCTFDEKKMRDVLKDKLSVYKIPSYFVVYDSFPTLNNGKIDVQTLKKDLIGKVAK